MGDQGKLSHLCQHGKDDEHRETKGEKEVDTRDDDSPIKRRKGKRTRNFTVTLQMKKKDYFYIDLITMEDCKILHRVYNKFMKYKFYYKDMSLQGEH